METRKKRWLMISLSIVISISSVLLIMLFTFDYKTFRSIIRIKPLFFLRALSLHALAWFVWAVRIKVMSKAVGGGVGNGISLRESFQIVVTNLFLAAITPSMIGGEPVRIFLLHKNGMKTGDATAVVVGERILDAVIILSAVPFAVIFLKETLFKTGEGELSYAFTVVFVLGIVLFSILLFFFIYSMVKPRHVKAFFYWLGNVVKKFPLVFRKIGLSLSQSPSHWEEKVEKEIDSFYSSFRMFAREGKKELCMGVFCTILYWLMEFMLPSLILLGFGADPVVLKSYAIQIILLPLVVLPLTPGNSGVAEISFAALYTPIVASSLLGGLVLLWRFLTYYMNLIVGGFLQYKIFS
jgi:hypothetical protein